MSTSCLTCKYEPKWATAPWCQYPVPTGLPVGTILSYPHVYTDGGSITFEDSRGVLHIIENCQAYKPKAILKYIRHNGIEEITYEI